MEEQTYEDDTKLTTNLMMVLCIVFGLLCIVSSILVEEKPYPYIHNLLKEFGIVIFAVFSVSFLYEITVARKYERRFLSRLRLQIEQGESNAAACAKLGIERIFITRDAYESEYTLLDAVIKANRNSTLRVIAKSSIQLMGKPDIFKKALQNGAIVELCLFDPKSDPSETAKSFGLEASDIQSALSVFRKDIARWLEISKPPGSLEVRFHKIPLNDSFLQVETANAAYCVWDVSFGRDNSSKRIFILDPEKLLGENLANRYGRIWSEAVTVFKYSAGFPTEDKLLEEIASTAPSNPVGSASRPGSSAH